MRELAAARIGATRNFYREGSGAAERRARLRAYLDGQRSPRLLLVGEAPGYRGARLSGVPFTSERQLSGSPPGESTATIVHAVLAELGLADDVLLWNVVPTHPYVPGRPRTNRPPTTDEVAAGLPFVRELARGRTVLAVGRVAHRALGAPYLRHPSHGGKAEFRTGLVHYASS